MNFINSIVAKPLNTVRRHCFSSHVFISLCIAGNPGLLGVEPVQAEAPEDEDAGHEDDWFDIDKEKPWNRDLILSLDMKVVQTMMIIRGGGFGSGGGEKFDKYVRFVVYPLLFKTLGESLFLELPLFHQQGQSVLCL